MPFTLYIQGSGTIARGKIRRVRDWGESKWSTLFWSGQHCHTHELPACLHKACASWSQSTLYHEGGGVSGVSTPNWASLDSWWLLGERETAFFKGMTAGDSVRLGSIWAAQLDLMGYLKSMTRACSWGSKKVWVDLGGAIGRGGVNMIKTHDVLIKLIRCVLKMHNVFYTHHCLTQHVFLTQKKRLKMKEQLPPLVSPPRHFSSSSSSTQDDVLTNSIQHCE